MVCEDKSLDIGTAEVQSIEEKLVALNPTSALPGSGASTCGVRGHVRTGRPPIQPVPNHFALPFIAIAKRL